MKQPAVYFLALLHDVQEIRSSQLTNKLQDHLLYILRDDDPTWIETGFNVI